MSRQRLIDDQGAVVDISNLIVLEACARGAAHGREVTIGDVALLADVAPSTATRLVDRAVARRWVRRTASGSGGRRTAVALTTDGSALHDRAVRARQAWLAGQLVGWDKADITRFGQLLIRFADGLDSGR